MIRASCHRPLKVLFLTSDSSTVAGVGPCLADLLENIQHNILEPVVVCPWEDKNSITILPRLHALGVPVVLRNLGNWMPPPCDWGLQHLGAFMRGLKSRVWTLAHLIDREGIDVVYTNGLPCIDGALAARHTGRPHVWHLHEAIRGNPDLKRYLPMLMVEQLVGRLSEAVIVNSNFLAAEFAGISRLVPLRVVHNGVNLAGYSAAASGMDAAREVRQELGIHADAPIVLAVGTVAPRKGYSTLIQAASIVLRHHPDVIFLIAGAELKEHHADLCDQIDQLGVSGRCRFLGPRQDIPRLLRAADIVVHSARQETFGRVIVEAMAASKPVVATCSGGPQEIMVHGETGFLVPVDSVRLMADRLSELLASDELRMLQGKAGNLRAMTHFSVMRYADEVSKVIHHAAGLD